jgi:hypothetical protein
MTGIRLRPEEIDHINALVDARDSAHLAGWTTSPFNAAAFNGGESLIRFPGGGGRQIPTTTLHRLRAEGLLNVYTSSRGGMTFDLVDDVRDRLEELRKATGLPSRLDELEAASLRAQEEAVQAREATAAAQTRVTEATLTRHRRYGTFASKVGRWARRGGIILLVLIYVAVATAPTLLATANLPVAAGAGVVVVTVLIGAFSWLFHRDGFAAAAWLERSVTNRVERWLLAFDEPQ